MAGHLGVSDDAFRESFTQPTDLSGWRMLEAKQGGPGSALTGDVSGPRWGIRRISFAVQKSANRSKQYSWTTCRLQVQQPGKLLHPLFTSVGTCHTQ